MARESIWGKEIIKRDGKIVGINLGYGFYGEHESTYNGPEQGKSQIDSLERIAFEGETIENTNQIRMFEFDDGMICITNDMDFCNYAERHRMSMDELQKNFTSYVGYDDTNQMFLKSIGYKAQDEIPGIKAAWACRGVFYLISKDRESNEILKTLYSEIQRKNVAVSNDYRFLFKDRGLSFIMLDQLTREELAKKGLLKCVERVKSEIDKKYIKMVYDQGLLRRSKKYPITIDYLYAQELKISSDDVNPILVIEYSKTNPQTQDRSYKSSTGYFETEKFEYLLTLLKTDELREFSDSHSLDDVVEYINSNMEEFRSKENKVRNFEIKEDDLLALASSQRSESVERRLEDLKRSADRWLNPDKEKSK